MTYLDEKILDAIGRTESMGPITVQPQDIRKYAIATGQTYPPFLTGEEAPPLFFMSLPWKLDPISDLAEDGLPQDDLIPALPLSKRMGGGMHIEIMRPIVAGDRLTAERTLIKIYEKQGRSGQLIFYETRLEIRDAAGRLVLRNHDERIAR